MKTQITPGFYVDFRDGVMKSSLKQSLTLKMTPPPPSFGKFPLYAILKVTLVEKYIYITIQREARSKKINV